MERTLRRRRRAWGILLAVMIPVLASCGGSQSTNNTGTSSTNRSTMYVRLPNQFAGTFDPARVPGDHGTVAPTWYPYDRLLALNPSDGLLEPYLATSWRISYAGGDTSITFTIKKGATCSDGTPVTPTVVANSLKRLVSPAIAKDSEVAWGAYYLNHGPYTITADDSADTVTFAEPYTNAELIYGFLWPQTGIVCPAGFAANANFNDHSYGSGPYVLTQRTANTVVMQRRPNWNWGPNGASNQDPGVPNTIVLEGVNSETTAANEMITGSIDAGPVFGPDVKRLEADPSIRESDYFSYISGYMFFNESAGHPTADPQVRRALMYAVTQQEWNIAANAGFGRIAPSSLFLPGTRCYDPQAAQYLPSSPGNLSDGEAVLKADGYTKGSNGMFEKNGKPLTVNILGSTQSASGPQYVLSQFQKMGVSATLTDVDPQSAFVDEDAGRFDVSFNTTGFSVPSPGTSANGWNGTPPVTPGSDFAQTTDPTLITTLKAALSSAGCQQWDQVQVLLLSHYHMLPLPALEWQWFASDKLSNAPVGFGAHLVPYSLQWATSK